jgi:hypothetical protein
MVIGWGIFPTAKMGKGEKRVIGYQLLGVRNRGAVRRFSMIFLIPDSEIINLKS